MEDAYAQLGFGRQRVGSAIKGPLSVSFVNATGLAEAGLDQGGLVKEFISEVVRDNNSIAL